VGLNVVGIIVTFALGLLAASLAADAQRPAQLPRIGVLIPGSPTAFATRVAAFRQGLSEQGYVEGQNVAIAYRFAEGKLERLPDLAAELVRLEVDVLVAGGGAVVARAAKNAAGALPIVMTNAADPVAEGFVASLARPGGNVTGLTSVSQDLMGKRLQLLKEAVSDGSRVAVLWNPDDPAKVSEFTETQLLARALMVPLRSLEVRSLNDIERAFEAASSGSTDALLTLSDVLTNTHRMRIVELAAKHRLPGMYPEREFAEAGGLMAYGPNYADLFRHAATYVAKILRGVKPADLPVQQPMKFELVINLKTAKALGLTMPPTLLFQADEVIQ
jgi:putative ABC transport system substrate-binding protein